MGTAMSTGMGTGRGYLLDNREVGAEERFVALSALFDATTFRHVDSLGIARGARVWEVGAGGPSVPRGLAARVGPDGLVVATDIAPEALTAAEAPGLRVLRHDVTTDDPPGTFDLVHARLVLTHLPRRHEALRRMAAALRPGGILLVEDFDIDLQPAPCLGDPDDVAQDRARRVREAFLLLLDARGVARRFGRALPEELRSLGLHGVDAEAVLSLPSWAGAVLEAANTTQLRAPLARTGLVSEAEIDAHLDALAGGDLPIAVPPLVSAWGRR
ncbi:methyltransferase domain-containing protein [Pseudonocardia yuanmonensis]|uniref:Methyltransferase domain-containing protein n=1 Tax=Pseudonocardia yuanmonensis TaxID=1095914 RepID=A0ABP8W8Q3_9PSEU